MSLHLYDLIEYADLERGIAEKLITVREANDGQRIYNYSDAALYTPGAWDNPAVRQCRGLIVRPDDTIEARPWAKFFNHGQAEAGELWDGEAVEVTDKLDGSLGIIHMDEAGSWRVATRGSFESDQAIHATEVLHEHYAGGLHRDGLITPLVEIVYPDNRIVCDYGDTDDLILLGGVLIETGVYLGPVETAAAVGWTGPLTTTFEYTTLRDALFAKPRPGAEGLCVRFLDRPHIVKIKQEDYVRLHRIVTGLSERSVWEHALAGGALETMLDDLPDELHAWTREVWDSLHDDARVILQHARAAHAEITAALRPDDTRREYAALANERGELRPYLFMILDGRDPKPAVLKSLKPAGDTRAKTISEAVA